MSWTRSPLMRVLALTAAVSLVVIHRDRGSAWFWVGVVLVVLNVVGILGSWRSAAGAGDAPSAHRSRRLDEWLQRPEMVSALAAGPEQWRQVSHLDDRVAPMSARDIAHHVWLERCHHGWEIGVDDEVRPYLDLDMDEADDPIIGVLRSHPSVEDAFHEDREVYVVQLREPMHTPDVAVLVARAVTAHHVQVAARS